MKTVLGVLLVAASMSGFAQQKACTPADAAMAEKMIDRVVNWEQLQKAYQDYRHCDQGAVADVFTDALLRCLVEWKRVEGLAKPMQADKEYHDFVYRHLRSPAAQADMKSVYSRAKMSCPKGLEAWCTELADAAKPLQPFQGIEMAPVPAFDAPPPKK